MQQVVLCVSTYLPVLNFNSCFFQNCNMQMAMKRYRHYERKPSKEIPLTHWGGGMDGMKKITFSSLSRKNLIAFENWVEKIKLIWLTKERRAFRLRPAHQWQYTHTLNLQGIMVNLQENAHKFGDLVVCSRWKKKKKRTTTFSIIRNIKFIMK